MYNVRIRASLVLTPWLTGMSTPRKTGGKVDVAGLGILVGPDFVISTKFCGIAAGGFVKTSATVTATLMLRASIKINKTEDIFAIFMAIWTRFERNWGFLDPAWVYMQRMWVTFCAILFSSKNSRTLSVRFDSLTLCNNRYCRVAGLITWELVRNISSGN